MVWGSLPQKLVALTALKLAALAAIYALAFAPFAHRPIDPATRIAGPITHP